MQPLTDSKKAFSGLLDAAVTLIALVMVLYHLLATQYLFLVYDIHKNLHLAFALVLVFLSGVKAGPAARRALLLVFTGLSLLLTGYVHIFYDDLVMRIGIPAPADMAVAVLLIGVVLEATRRSFGIMLPVFSLVFVAYAFFGHNIPGPLNLPLFNAEHIISKIALDFRGIYGVILGISANYIFLFVIFGSFMKCTGTVKFFEQVGRMIGKKFRGGPALSAISTSALFGMFTGAASSNVVLTGSFTIPAMKKAGYTAEEAGAIEASASTVGQVMPPVMGAAAFVMADFTDQPYIQIIRLAAVPAVLTYFSMAVYVQLRAMKNRMVPSDEPVDYRQMLRVSHLFFIPLIVLTALLIKGFSPNYAVFWAIVALAVLSPILKETRLPWRYWVDAFVEGAIVGSRIAVMCAAIGIVVATIIMSGLGIKMPGAIAAVSGENMTVALFLTMIASMILGLGMPTTAAYTLVAFTVAPFLIKSGLGVVPTHFFVFYFAVFSLVTPPVAPAVVTASALSGGRFFKSGIEASKVAIGGFLLPFLMIYCPVLLLQPESWSKGVFDSLIILIILFGVQVVFVGHFLVDCSRSERLFMAVSIGCLVLYAGSGNILYSAGLAGFLGLVVFQVFKQGRTSAPNGGGR